MKGGCNMTIFTIRTPLDIFIDIDGSPKLVEASTGKIWTGSWDRLQGGYERGFYLDEDKLIPLDALTSLREEEMAIIEIPATTSLGREEPSTEEWTSIEEGVPCTLRLAVVPRQYFYRGEQTYGECAFEAALQRLIRRQKKAS